MTHPGGRPPIYSTPEELQEAIDRYFVLCDSRTRLATVMQGDEFIEKDVPDPEKYTVSGLALSLGFTSRQSIYDYSNREEFSYTIKRAVLRIENQREIDLLESKNPTGIIFALKNMGWKDKQELEHTGLQQPPSVLSVRVVGQSKEERRVERGNSCQ